MAEGHPRPARGPLHRSPHRAGEVPSARAASPARPPAPGGSVRGMWGRFLFPGCGRAARAGKLTCAGAPPLVFGCLLAQPDAEGRRGAELPAAPLGRICLPPRARVLALTLPCF